MRHGVIVPALLGVALAGPAHAQSHAQSQFHAQSHTDGRAPSALFHGNYCGPGNNAPAAPIDALDAACARHDGCSPDSGPAPKACNLRLQRDAEAVSQDPHQSRDLRTLAGFVSVGASMMASAPGPVSEAAAPRDPNGTVRPVHHR